MWAGRLPGSSWQSKSCWDRLSEETAGLTLIEGGILDHPGQAAPGLALAEGRLLH